MFELYILWRYREIAKVDLEHIKKFYEPENGNLTVLLCLEAMVIFMSDMEEEIVYLPINKKVNWCEQGRSHVIKKVKELMNKQTKIILYKANRKSLYSQDNYPISNL